MPHLPGFLLSLLVVFCFSFIDNADNALAAAATTTPTTAVPVTKDKNELTSTHRPPIIINNNIPTVDVNCMVRYKCVEKLKNATVPPKPCVKYCVKFIECPNAPKIRGAANQCYELDQSAVREQYEKAIKGDSTVHVMKVAMIDFPCRPGYLPDDNGICREIW